VNDYVIAVASTCDIEASYLESHDIPFIKYPIVIEGKEYRDDCTSEMKQFVYQKMREGIEVSTAAISPFEYYQFFHELMQEGKDVIYVDMSRAVSSSINNVEIVLSQIREEFPKQRFHFLDSFCITGGLNLLVKQLVRLKEEGKDFDEVINWGEQHKLEYIHRFMVEDLKWLAKGGRLSNASAFAGSLLSIKPLILITNEGKLLAHEKVRGRKKCLKKLIESMANELCDNTALEEIGVISADDREDCLLLIEEIKKMYPQLKDSNFVIIDLGPTICAHVGPDFVGLAYRGSKRIM